LSNTPAMSLTSSYSTAPPRPLDELLLERGNYLLSLKEVRPKLDGPITNAVDEIEPSTAGADISFVIRPSNAIATYYAGPIEQFPRLAAIL
ncbi:hypothetical protein V502_03491, partial [Pseudogymnoascus sp. VKM F-4520 (FW-2644)]